MSNVPTSPFFSIHSRGPEETERIGECLGRLLLPGDVVGLVGGLGAGKTCFARGVARGAGVEQRTYVSSPTFTLVNEYPGRIMIVHIDLYRIDDPGELVELGMDHYLGGEGACLIEWYDRFGEAELGGGALMVEFALQDEDDHRQVSVRGGPGHRCQQLAEQWQAALSAEDKRSAT